MDKRLSERQYNIVIGAVLLWGFAVNAIMCKFFPHVFMEWDGRVVIIGYFISAIAGIAMSAWSSKPLVSFIGYNLIVLPIGVVLSITLQDYYAESIANAFLLTSLLTFAMIAAATIKPDIFESLGMTLFFCLSGVIVFEFFMIIFETTIPQWWDWLVGLLFCGYIGYDWCEAQKKRKTLDNAVDSAVDLYLDIINLFLRLLGSKKDD